MRYFEADTARDIPAMFIGVGAVSALVEMPLAILGSDSARCLIISSVAVAYAGGVTEFIVNKFSSSEPNS